MAFWQTAKELASQAAAGGADLAQSVGAGAMRGAQAAGSGIARGAASLKQTVEDDRARYQEIKEIERRGGERARAAETLQQAARRGLEREAAAWDADVARVRETVLESYVAFARYLSRTAVLPEKTAGAATPGTRDFSGDLRQDAGASLFGAGVAGVAAGAGAIGLMTALGTASTGAALSSLSGAAAFNATLAAFGGGSLASGGLGMMGGAAVLGAVAAAPAVGVMGFLADKSIKKNYEKAQAWEQEVATFEREAAKTADLADTLAGFLREKSKLLAQLASFGGDLLNAGPAMAAFGREKNYAPVLHDTMAALLACIELPVATETGASEEFPVQLAALEKTAGECRQRFYAFLFTLAPTQQQFLLTAQREDIGAHADDLAGWVEILRQSLARMEESVRETRREMHERFDQVDAAAEEIRGSLAVLAGDLRQMQQETAASLAQAGADARAQEQAIAALAERMSARLLDAVALRQEARRQKAEARLAAAFGADFARLLPASRRFLVSAAVLFGEMQELTPDLDCSGVCLLAVKALESELKERLFARYAAYLEKTLPFASEAPRWPAALAHKLRRGGYQKVTAAQFTLGTVPFVCGTRTPDWMDDARHQRELSLLCRYGADALFRTETTRQEAQEIFTRVGRLADTAAQKYRNPAAHVGALGVSDARACLALLVTEGRALPWLLETWK